MSAETCHMKDQRLLLSGLALRLQEVRSQESRTIFPYEMRMYSIQEHCSCCQQPAVTPEQKGDFDPCTLYVLPALSASALDYLALMPSGPYPTRLMIKVIFMLPNGSHLAQFWHLQQSWEGTQTSWICFVVSEKTFYLLWDHKTADLTFLDKIEKGWLFSTYLPEL